MEMFSRKNAKTDSIGSCESVEVQVDFGSRTCATNTEEGLVRTVGSCTEKVFVVDREIAMDVLPLWDAAVQYAPPSRDAGTDPGEWNLMTLHGVDAQTDAPALKDPMLWFTGSFSEVNSMISSLLDLLEEYHLGDSGTDLSGKELRTSLQHLADNTLLRIEVAELKRKLSVSSYTGRTLLGQGDTWTPPRASTVAALTGGYTASETYKVANLGDESYLAVTASLAPSSFQIGRLKVGDKVLTAGTPEDIMGLVRVPVLPRGWVTLTDPNRIYLSKV